MAWSVPPFILRACVCSAAFVCGISAASATPANKAALVKHYERFLPQALNRCSTCHLPSTKQAPETLAEFPHNPFGARLRQIGEETAQAGRKADLPKRLSLAALEDADKDGAANEVELLLGRNPGDPKDAPSAQELAAAPARAAEFARLLAAYR